MTTPRQDMKRLKIILACHKHIKVKGANKRIMLLMPGTPKGPTTKRYSAKGPRGQVITQTYDRKKTLVLFEAARLLTSLEKVRRRV